MGCLRERTPKRSNKWIMLTVAVAVLFAAHLIGGLGTGDAVTDETAATLTLQGGRCLAALIVTLVLWASGALPISVTSLGVLLLLPALGLIPFSETVRIGFGDSLVAFLIGTFLLSAAVMRSGLGRRVVYLVLSKVGNRASTVIAAFLVTGALSAMWMTQVAAAAFLTPLAADVVGLGETPETDSRIARGLLIACAWGPVIGGIGTPVGSSVNVISMKFLRDLAGIDLSFTDWMAIGIPAMVLMLPVAWLLLIKAFHLGDKRMSPTIETLGERLSAMGRMSPKELWTLAILSLTALLWIFGRSVEDFIGISIPMAAVPLLGGILTFVLEIMTWEEAQALIDWRCILLVVAGLPLGTSIYRTGAARWVGQLLFAGTSRLPLAPAGYITCLLVSLVHLLIPSHAAVGSVLVPTVIAVTDQLSAPAQTVAMATAMSSSLAFVLVTSTPTLVIPYSTGRFTVKDMAGVGMVMSLVSAACVTASLMLFGRLHT